MTVLSIPDLLDTLMHEGYTPCDEGWFDRTDSLRGGRTTRVELVDETVTVHGLDRYMVNVWTVSVAFEAPEPMLRAVLAQATDWASPGLVEAQCSECGGALVIASGRPAPGRIPAHLAANPAELGTATMPVYSTLDGDTECSSGVGHLPESR